MKKKVIERIVRGSGAPNTQDIWLNDNLEMKVYENEEWKTISGGDGSDDGSGSGGGAECSCLSPMVVTGTLDENNFFVPASGSPTWAEAQAHMLNGGILFLRPEIDGFNGAVGILATMLAEDSIAGGMSPMMIIWPNSSSGDPDSGGDDQPSDPSEPYQ